MGFNLNDLISGLTPVVRDALERYMKGPEKDLQGIAAAIAESFAFSIAMNDRDWTAELQAQTRGLLEIERIRFQAVDFEAVEHILGIIFRAAATGLIAAL